MDYINVPDQDLVELIEKFSGNNKDEFEYWIREFSQPAMQKWFWNYGYIVFDKEFENYMTDEFYKWKNLNHNI